MDDHDVLAVLVVVEGNNGQAGARHQQDEPACLVGVATAGEQRAVVDGGDAVPRGSGVWLMPLM